MAQIFSRSADRRLRILAGSIILCTIAGIVGLKWYAKNQEEKIGLVVAQPIEFSHRQHIENTELICADCHRGAHDGPQALLPGKSICLECHDDLFRGTPKLQPLHEAKAKGLAINWKPVSKLPEFVHFHHGVHFEANVECSNCHGDVSKMESVSRAKPLTMDFCIDCHRESQSGENFSTKQAVSWQRDLTDCSVCHY